MEFDVYTHKEENLLIIRVTGDLNAVTCSRLEDCFNDIIEKGETQIILDLESVSYISSAGLRVLLDAAQKLHGKGKLVLSSAIDQVREILDMTGFMNIMEIFDDLDHARKSAFVKLNKN